ncbi:MAG: hypothetical protein ACOCP4_06535 [Candidatus Woesearchaeota archaeon]
MINEKELTMEIWSDLLYEELEDLGDYLTIKEMDSYTVCHDEWDFKKLVSEGKLPAVKFNGVVMVKKKDFVEYHAKTVPYIPKEEVLAYYGLEDEVSNNIFDVFKEGDLIC